jgi:hypothetical protein
MWFNHVDQDPGVKFFFFFFVQSRCCQTGTSGTFSWPHNLFPGCQAHHKALFPDELIGFHQVTRSPLWRPGRSDKPFVLGHGYRTNLSYQGGNTLWRPRLLRNLSHHPGLFIPGPQRERKIVKSNPGHSMTGWDIKIQVQTSILTAAKVNFDSTGRSFFDLFVSQCFPFKQLSTFFLLILKENLKLKEYIGSRHWSIHFFEKKVVISKINQWVTH